MKSFVAIFLIVILAFVLRFYNIATIPPSQDWDEASLSWNAYSILKTGTDEYGNAHPVSIRSFNDFKPPLYVYTLVPFQAIFGSSDWVTRAPSALFGSLTVLVMFFLGWLLAKKKVGLAVALLFAVTPWTVQFSRVAFEANLALFWFTLGVLGVCLFIKKEKGLYLILSTVCLLLAMYAYHSTRIAVPVFVLLVALLNVKLFWRKKLFVIIAGLIFVVGLLPLARNYVRVGGTQARFESVSIFNAKPKLETDTKIEKINALPFIYYPQIITRNWLSHLDFKFLFLTADNTDRHHAPDSGLLLFGEIAALISAFILVVRKRPSWLGMILVLIFVAPLASSISTGSPHAVRGLLLVVPLTFLSGFGIVGSLEFFKSKWKLVVAGIWSVVLFASVFYFTHQYFIHMPVEFARNWQYGYKQLVEKVLAVENNYDAVVVTTYYDQPYIYFLNYGRISPVIKNDSFFFQGMDKYVFHDPADVELYDKKLCCKILIAAAPHEEVPGANIIDKIYFPNGSVAFNIWSKQVRK